MKGDMCDEKGKFLYNVRSASLRFNFLYVTEGNIGSG